MRVLFFAPGFPYEMPFFVRGLAQAGAQVVGLGDQPLEAVPEPAASVLEEYLRVDRLWDEEAVLDEVRSLAERLPLDRVECLWEPGMLLAARLREELGLPGMTHEETLRFRDKERMKAALDSAGLRTPRHARATSAAECREAAKRIGFPLIVKPIAGAGSADTHRIDHPADLDRVLPSLRHVAEMSVEEYVPGEEYTFDTICSEGRIEYFNVAWYRPKPLYARTQEWMSPQTVTLRDPLEAKLAPGRALGEAVLRALDFRTGFTHMEWFLTPEGEAVFGEIAARPPGARSVELMNYACDIDVFRGWGEVATGGPFSQQVARPYNAAIAFKRARGEGRIQRIEGLGRLLYRYGPHVVNVSLLPPGSPRRDWKQTLVSDGYLIVRHPDLATTLEMADRIGTDLQIYAQ